MSPFLHSLLLLLIGSLLFVCLDAEQSNINETSKPRQEPAHFVLVHGYGGGAWCWYKIITRLEAAGYNATSLDLKGAGTDLTDPKTVHTFQHYNKPLIDFLEKLPDDEKVILVGHSAGGLSVTDASYKFNKKIHIAVYVAALMFKYGDWEEEALDRHNMEPQIRRGGNLNERVKSQTISKEDAVLKRILYHVVPLEAIRSAVFKGNDVERVKRVYIKTLNDKTIIPQRQEAMIQKWPPAKIFEVESGHEIILSEPKVLSDLLVNIANSNI